MVSEPQYESFAGDARVVAGLASYRVPIGAMLRPWVSTTFSWAVFAQIASLASAAGVPEVNAQRGPAEALFDGPRESGLRLDDFYVSAQVGDRYTPGLSQPSLPTNPTIGTLLDRGLLTLATLVSSLGVQGEGALVAAWNLARIGSVPLEIALSSLVFAILAATSSYAVVVLCVKDIRMLVSHNNGIKLLFQSLLRFVSAVARVACIYLLAFLIFTNPTVTQYWDLHMQVASWRPLEPITLMFMCIGLLVGVVFGFWSSLKSRLAFSIGRFLRSVAEAVETIELPLISRVEVASDYAPPPSEMLVAGVPVLEAAMATSTESFMNASIRKNIGLLYGEEDGNRVFVGMCGRVDNCVVTVAHNFSSSGKVWQQLRVVPAFPRPGCGVQSTVLKLKDAFVIKSSEYGAVGPTRYQDVVCWMVKADWPVLARLTSSWPTKASPVAIVSPRANAGSFILHKGPLFGLKGGIVTHGCTTDNGTSGSLIYQIRGAKPFVVGMHVGSYENVNYGYSSSMFSSLMLESPASYLEFDSVPLRSWREPVDDDFVNDLPQRTRDINIANLEYIEPGPMRALLRRLDDDVDHHRRADPDYLDWSMESRVRDHVGEIRGVRPQRSPFMRHNPVAYTSPSQFSRRARASPIFETAAYRRPPSTDSAYTVLRAPVAPLALSDYERYLKGFELEEVGVEPPVGFFQLSRVGKMALPFTGEQRQSWVPVLSDPSLEAVIPYAGKYFYPPKSAEAQRVSLIEHCNVHEKSAPLDHSRLDSAIDRLVGELSTGTPVFVPKEVTDAIAGRPHGKTESQALQYVHMLHVKEDSAPGVLFQKAGYMTKKAVLEAGAAEFLTLVYQRIHSIASGQLHRDPIKVFVKEEPHSVKKKNSGKCRLISMVSMVDEFAEKMLLSIMNGQFIDKYLSIPLKPGMGNLDVEAEPFFEQLRRGDANYIMTSDISSFDWNVESQWFAAEAKVRSKLWGQPLTFDSSPTTSVAEVFRRLSDLIISSEFVLSDGSVYRQAIPGIQRSGRYNTSVGNSIIRTLMQYYVRKDTLASHAMGDDHVCSFKMSPNVKNIEKAFKEIGVPVKDIVVCSLGKSQRVLQYEFCSHYYTEMRVGPNPTYTVVPVRPDKTMARFSFTARASNVTDEQRIDQARSVAQHIRMPATLSVLINYAFKPSDGSAVVDEDEFSVPGEPVLILQSASGQKIRTMPKKTTGAKPGQVKNKQKKKVPQQAVKRSIQVVRAPATIGYQVGKSDYSITSLKDGHIRVRGHELLGELYASQSGVAGVFDCNPSCWGNSRLALLAKAYEKYRYNNMKVTYMPSVSTNTSGAVVSCVETDPDERIPAGAGSIQRVMNYSFAALSPLWKEHTIRYNRNPEDKVWYSASSAGEMNRSSFTQFVVASITDTTPTPGSLLGRLVAEYDIEFLYPELEYQDGGAQYVGASITFPTASAGSPVLCTTTQFPGSQIVEIRNLDSMVLDSTNQRLLDYFDFVPGAVAYLALVGGNWALCRTLAAAKAGAGLVWTNSFPVSRTMSVLGRVIKAGFTLA